MLYLKIKNQINSLFSRKIYSFIIYDIISLEKALIELETIFSVIIDSDEFCHIPEEE